MKQISLLAFVWILVGMHYQATAQQADGLFVPRNFQSVYEKGTRGANGAPGPNYWQNRAEYDISVNLNPKTKQVSGEASIAYINNSPDTLRKLRFKLIHDIYRTGAMRTDVLEPQDVKEEVVHIESITYQGKSIEKGSWKEANTFLDLKLSKTPVAPGERVSITIKWSYTLPSDKHASRECVCDASTFFVPYFYPQVAVYDDYHGWADAPFTGQQEFYHDFADYKVRITLPAGYMAWATGEWQNPEELLLPAVLEKWKAAHSSAEVINIWTEEELKAGKVFKKMKQHVFQYEASNVPDFTFAASDHYNWDACSVVVDSTDRRRTFVSAVYDSNSQDFSEVARIAADGILLMSNWLPGYPFPYPCMTVFNGNDAMEYPMMVNDASVSKNYVVSLTVHEVSHTYFPFMMGINEQDYAWMDEGWASFFDYLLADSLGRGDKGAIRGFSNVSGTDAEVPPMVRSRFLNGSAYGIASYSRPQAAYLGLLDLLGYEQFHHCMVGYMDRWKGKHPMPYDFFYSWNDLSGQNLNWYWKPWFFDWGYPDLGINGVVVNEAFNRQEVLIDANGNLPIPIHLLIEYADGSKETVHKSPDVWKNGSKQYRIAGAEGKTIVKLKLGNASIPDAQSTNNKWQR